MCRIAGFWDFNPGASYDRKTVMKAMRDSLYYGGPDAAGLFQDEEICLGHRRLSILDLSEAGNQPFELGDYIIVFNGEVYNFHEIRKKLEEEGLAFKTETDTEVILQAFIRWKDKAVDHFRGMFAFAIWHKREKKLWIFRDRIGVKPLYWYWKRNLFMFSSELKAFHQHPHFDKSLNKNSVGQFLQRGYISSPCSIFSNVRKLLPGHFLTLSKHDPEPRSNSYWTVDESYQKNDLSKASKAEISERLEEVLQESFMLRMVADVPVGMFLSGGIDSSLVTALIQKQSLKPVKTFTIGFEDPTFNEAPHAHAVAQHLKTDHHELICSEKDFKDIIPLLPEIYDEPFGDSSAIPTYLVSQFAKKYVKVSLSADGGDELFGGYTKYEITQNVYPQIKRIPLAIRKQLAGLGTIFNPYWLESRSSQMPYLKNYSGLSNKLHKFFQALPAASPTEFFMLSSVYYTPQQIRELLPDHSQVAPKIDLPILDKKALAYLGLIDVKSYLEADIMTKVDRATMKVALEGREPFLDHHIIEFAMGIPDSLKIVGNNTKILLRDILYKYVPKDLIDRPKKGFSIPVEFWLKSHLKTQLMDIAADKSFLDLFSLDSNTVYQQIYTFLKGKKYINPHGIWFLFVLHQWYEKWMK